MHGNNGNIRIMISEEKFREMLSHHDINYVYHDDYSIWLKGKVEKQFIDCVLNDQPNYNVYMMNLLLKGKSLIGLISVTYNFAYNYIHRYVYS